MADELPYYETLFGVYLDHLDYTYGGTFTDSHFILAKEYFNEGCATTDSSACVDGANQFLFLYPFWIKKQYYLEGVVEGQFTLSVNGGTSSIVSYEIRLMKLDDISAPSQVGTTGVKTLNFALNWDAGLSVGDEIVIPFSFQTSKYVSGILTDSEVKMTDKERLYIEINLITSGDFIILYHSNDSTWEDIKIAIPFRGL